MFDSKGWTIKDGVQNGRQLGSQDLFDQHTRLKPILFFIFLDV